VNVRAGKGGALTAVLHAQQVHASCLTRWALEKRSTTCEICCAPYIEPFGSQLASRIAALPPKPGQAPHAHAATGGGMGGPGSHQLRLQHVTQLGDGQGRAVVVVQPMPVPRVSHTTGV
jgi:hypothetical protein